MPELSIILAARDKLEYTRQCIGILQEYELPPHEIIVVNNGSVDNTASWLKKRPDIITVRGAADWGLARAFNAGAKAAGGKYLLFMHNDTVCSKRAIPVMMRTLEPDHIAAAGPFTNRCRHYGQFVHTEPYQSLEDMQRFADGLESMSPEPRLFLENFCLMVKSEAFRRVGGFDERFYRIGYEDADLSFRLAEAGYRLYRAPVYVHHEGGSFESHHISRAETLAEAERIFREKWKVNIGYSSYIRYELLRHIDIDRPGLSVLEAGCALGGNLMYIKEKNPSARVCGMELDSATAAFASHFGAVLAADVEKIDFEIFGEKFDYVIAGDIIEHLVNPWKFLKSIRKALTPSGKIIASIPNVANISNLCTLLQGRWNYEDEGLLDRTHLRFFTKDSILQMFREAGFEIEKTEPNVLSYSGEWQKLIDDICALPQLSVNKEDLTAYQWYVIAHKADMGTQT